MTFLRSASETLPLDPRFSIYTRVGDAFPIVCALVAGAFAAVGIVRWRKARQIVYRMDNLDPGAMMPRRTSSMRPATAFPV